MFLDKFIRQKGEICYNYKYQTLFLKTKSHNKSSLITSCVCCDFETAKVSEKSVHSETVTFSIADYKRRFVIGSTVTGLNDELIDDLLKIWLDISHDKLKIYFHNLDFDGFFILTYFLHHGFKELQRIDKKIIEKSKMTDKYFSCIINANKIIQIEVLLEGKLFTIWDTLKTWCSSIDEISNQCIKLGYEMILPKKSGTEWDYTKIRPVGSELTENEITYQYNDVLVMTYILEIFGGFLGKLKMTISSTAFGIAEKSFFQGVFSHDTLVYFLRECFYKKNTKQLNNQRFNYFFNAVRDDENNQYIFYSNNYKRVVNNATMLFTIPFNELKNGNKTTLKTLYTKDNYNIFMNKINTIHKVSYALVLNYCKKSIYFYTLFNKGWDMYDILDLFFYPSPNPKRQFKLINKLHFDIFNFVGVHKNKVVNSYALDKMIRCAYLGGKTQANEIYQNEVKHGLFGLDINSSYPYQMATHKMPFGKCKIYDEYISEKENTVVLYKLRCDYQLIRPYTPYISKKSYMGNARSSPKGTVVEQYENAEYIYLFANELKMFKATHKVENLIIFQSFEWNAFTGMFYHFIDKMYYIKSNYKGTALYTPSKVVMNGVSGKYGQSMFTMNEYINDIYIDNHNVLKLDKKENADFNPEEITAKFLPIVMYITACGRVQLMKAQKEIADNGGEVYYMDTDSLYFHADTMEKTTDNYIKINGGLTNIKVDKKELGAWDVEHGKLMKNNFYSGEQEGKFLCPKRYYLYEPNNEPSYTIRCAGLSKPEQQKLTKDNFNFGYIAKTLQKHRHENGVDLIETEKLLKYSYYIYKTDKGNVIDSNLYNISDTITNQYNEKCKVLELIYNPKQIN